jgi:hypothetical protein
VTASLTLDERRLARCRYEPETPDQFAEQLRLAAERRRLFNERQRHKRAHPQSKREERRAGHGRGAASVTAPLTPGAHRFKRGRYDDETQEQLAARLQTVAERRKRDLGRQKQSRASLKAKRAAESEDAAE